MELRGAARPAQGSSEGMADGDHGWTDALATINLFHFPIVSRAGTAAYASQCRLASQLVIHEQTD